MTNSRPTAQTVLLAGLLPEETGLIRNLISAFELEALPIAIDTLKDPGTIFSEKEICLAVFHVEEQRKGQKREIRRLAGLLARPVPLLVLVPPSRAADIRDFIQAGADDFSLLPLDEESFSIRFYILLEWGQALLQTPKPVYPWDEYGQQSTKNLWRRLVSRLQEGIGFFSPASLTDSEDSARIFHKWRKIRRIGGGGFGDVWLVEEVGRARRAVAKIPHARAMNIRALRSAAILKRLIHHPNIVHLLEVVKDEGKYVLIQEYVEGQTLEQLLEKGPAAVLKEILFMQLLAVTAFAHHHKIMHRDIKPENILITPEGQLKLLDFGIARDLTWQKPDTVSEGTLNFMPPEQFQGRSSLASDVWALGVILYVLATGCYPLFQQNNLFPMDVEMDSTIPAPHDLDSRVSDKLEQVIMKCLESDPEKRYADAVALQEDILKSLPGFGKGLILPEHPAPATARF
jgi:hypothetical protein